MIVSIFAARLSGLRSHVFLRFGAGVCAAGLLALPAAASTASQVALTVSSASVSAGTVVTLTATVTDLATGTVAVKPGVVVFCKTAATPCLNANLLGQAQLQSTGKALLRLRLPAATYSLFADFQGNVAYTKSANASGTGLTVTAGVATPGLYGVFTHTLSTSGSAPSYTLTDSIYGDLSTAPTGTVTFVNQSAGNAVVGTATLGAATTGVQAAKLYATATLPPVNAFLLKGDLNNDGWMDVITGGTTPGGVYAVGQNNGDGTFTFTSGTGTPGSLVAMATGDFNGDGNVDLVVTNGATVNILLGNGTIAQLTGTPTFTSVYSGTVVRALAVADINGDGNADLVIADNNALVVLTGKGDGTFNAATNFTPANVPYGVLIADFNGDGFPDVVTTAATGTITYFQNAATRAATAAFTVAAGTPYTLGSAVATPVAVAGDLKGDGKLDIVVPATGGFATILGSGTGTFSGAFTTTVTGASVNSGIAVADVDNDGKLDVVMGSGTNAYVTLLPGKGDNTFGTTVTYATPASIDAVMVGDFAGAGTMNVVAGSAGYAQGLAIFYQGSHASAALAGVHVPGPGAQTVQAQYPGDTNFAASNSNTVTLNGGTVGTTTTLAVAAGSPASSATLTATVVPSSATYTLGGTVSFYRSNSSVALCAGVSVTVSAPATCAVTSQPIGTLSLYAVYNGDVNFIPSTSAIVAYTVPENAASQLVYTTPPTASLNAGQTPGFIGVQEEDAGGVPVSNKGDTITLTITNVTAGTTFATMTTPTVNGLALFDTSAYPLLEKGVSSTFMYAATGTHGGSALSAASVTQTVATMPVYEVMTAVDTVNGITSHCKDHNVAGTVSGDGSCNLRDAFAAAAGASSSIIFAPAVTGNIAFVNSSATIAIAKSVNLTGPGGGGSAISITGTSGVVPFSVTASASPMSVNVSGLTFLNSTSSSTPGGAFAVAGGAAATTMTFTNDVFNGNQSTASTGGAVNFASTFGTGGGVATFNFCTFTGNKSMTSGGALNVAGGTVNINNSYFTGNQSQNSNGGAVAYSGTAAATTIQNTTFYANTAFNNGGAIYTGSGNYNLVLNNVTMAANVATTGYGGGLDKGTLVVATVNNSYLIANTTTFTGADLYNSTMTGAVAPTINKSVASIAGTSPYPSLAAAGLALPASNGPIANLPLTMLPLPGSPAILQGSSAYGTGLDARGFLDRPAGVDQGAVQNYFSLAFTTQPPASVNAGSTFAAGVTVYESGSAYTAASVPVTLGLSPGVITSGGTASTSAGVASFASVLSSTAEATTYLTAAGLGVSAGTGAIAGASNNFTIAANAATKFAVTAPSNATAGVAVTMTVTALDTYGNIATGYSGTVALSSTDAAAMYGGATLPRNVTLGVAFTGTTTAASVTVTAVSSVAGLVVGQPVYGTGMAAGATIASIGSTTITLSAKATANGTGVALTAAPGVGSFAVTLKTAGAKTLTATDTVSSGINGTSSAITVSAGAATVFTVSAPANAPAGTAVSVTVTAKDVGGNTATGYAGTVHLTSSDASATLGGDAMLHAGVGTFAATFATTGTQTVTATDTVSAGITGVTGNVTVTAAASTITVGSSNASSMYGASITLTATLSSSTSTALANGDTVTFKNGASVLGTGTFATAAGVTTATLTTAALNAGTYSVTAGITGAAYFGTVTSGVFTQTVNKLSPTFTYGPTASSVFAPNALGAGALNATGNSTPGTFAYTATLLPSGSPVAVTSGTALGAGVYTLTATLTPTDTTDYNTAALTAPFTVLSQTVFVINPGGSAASFYHSGSSQGSALGGGIGAAVDGSGQVWSINTNGAGVTVFSDAGAVAATYTPTGLAAGKAVAIGGLGGVFVVEGGTTNAVYAIKPNGTPVSAANLPIAAAGNISAPASIAVDAAGSLWIANAGNGTLTEVIGVSAPVGTPAVTATTNGTQASRP